MTSSNNQQEAT